MWLLISIDKGLFIPYYHKYHPRTQERVLGNESSQMFKLDSYTCKYLMYLQGFIRRAKKVLDVLTISVLGNITSTETWERFIPSVTHRYSSECHNLSMSDIAL